MKTTFETVFGAIEFQDTHVRIPKKVLFSMGKASSRHHKVEGSMLVLGEGIQYK